MKINLKPCIAILLCLVLTLSSFSGIAQDQPLELQMVQPAENDYIAETITEEQQAVAEENRQEMLLDDEASAEDTFEESVPDTGAQLAAAVDGLLIRLDENGFETEEERAAWFYEMLLENVEPGEGSEAYNALILCTADSFGYARILEVLLNAAGMDCMVVEGMNGAAWNIACLDGRWVHMDAYMDDVQQTPMAHFGLTDE